MTPPPASHIAKSLSHLEAAKAARLHLDDAYASGRADRAEIAELHQQIGFGLKVAEIHALLAIVGPAGPPPAPVDASAGYTGARDERFGTTSRLS